MGEEQENESVGGRGGESNIPADSIRIDLREPVTMKAEKEENLPDGAEAVRHYTVQTGGRAGHREQDADTGGASHRHLPENGGRYGNQHRGFFQDRGPDDGFPGGISAKNRGLYCSRGRGGDHGQKAVYFHGGKFRRK